MPSSQFGEEKKFPGVYLGEVAQVRVEGHPPGCIRVKIPSVFGDDNDTELFPIAQPCFPHGHFFVPKEQDKVWLAFEGGDPMRPVWLGVWYVQGSASEDINQSSQETGAIDTKPNYPVILHISDDKIEIRSKGKIAIDASTLSLCGRLVDPTTNRTI